MTTGRRKLVLGLAGGIGSGKSTVASILAESGLGVIDSDALNREALACPDVVAKLVEWFGESVLDRPGCIDRRALARVIFSDTEARDRVEGLLHPRIAARREDLIEAYQADPEIRAVALDSPLLFETGLDRRCDVVIFVEASKEDRCRRVQAVRGWTPHQWRQREKSQEALDNKRSRADHIVVNNSGLDELRSQVKSLLSTLLAETSGT